MIPCLYQETEKSFNTNGIGKLCDATICLVTEKRNGAYELKLTYPVTGLHAEELAEGAVILAKPSEKAVSQPFRIYKITAPLTGLLEVSARHIQYQENFITVSPFTANGCAAAMEGLKKNATTECPFSFVTDIDSKAVFTFNTPSTIRNCLGGMEGSLLDTFGGEYEWDGYTTYLHARRGADNHVRIVYGKNLLDFKMERSIGNVITGVHPYWRHSEDGTLLQLPERVVTVERDDTKPRGDGRTLPYEKITPLDCTSEFGEKPTESQLRAFADDYLKNTVLTEPDVDISVDFLQLWQTPGYEDIAAAERVSLCDTVHVYISKLGIEVSCKVTETVYDTLLEKYKSITLSNAAVSSRNSSLSSALGSISDEAAMATEAVNRVETSVADARALTIQQEYFNKLATGLLGLHYSTGMAEDGSTVRYAYTGEKPESSAFVWKSGSSGFFLSLDGGRSWQYGWDTEEKVIKTAADVVGIHAESILGGTLKTALVKILGTEQFFWEGDAIVMSDPKNAKKFIKIGQYTAGKYGIAVSSDGGLNWTEAVGFQGVSGGGPGGSTTVVEKELILKSEKEPVNPALDTLWIDKSMSPMRLKLWDGKTWQIVGYEPETSDPEPDTPVAPTIPEEGKEGEV